MGDGAVVKGLFVDVSLASLTVFMLLELYVDFDVFGEVRRKKKDLGSRLYFKSILSSILSCLCT